MGLTLVNHCEQVDFIININVFRECWENQHYDPSVFRNDPGGICYAREAVAPDWVFDQWHPWEKVNFYFYLNLISVCVFLLSVCSTECPK